MGLSATNGLPSAAVPYSPVSAVSAFLEFFSVIHRVMMCLCFFGFGELMSLCKLLLFMGMLHLLQELNPCKCKVREHYNAWLRRRTRDAGSGACANLLSHEYLFSHQIRNSAIQAETRYAPISFYILTFDGY